MSFVLYNHAHARSGNQPDTRSLEEILLSAIESDQLSELLLLVPTGRKVRALERVVVRESFRRHGKPIQNIPVKTFEEFIHFVAQKLFGTQTPRIISPSYRLALVEEADNHADLEFFREKESSLSPAVLERLANIIWGLKEDGITPYHLQQDLSKAADDPSIEIEPRRLRDVKELYSAYEHLLAESNGSLADATDLVLRVVKYITHIQQEEHINQVASSENTDEIIKFQSDVWSNLFPTIRFLIIDGFSEFKLPERNLLETLIHAPFPVWIRLDFSRHNGPLFANLAQTLESLQRIGFSTFAPDDAQEQEYALQPEHKRQLHTYIRRYLFNTEQQILHEGFSQHIRILQSTTRNDEVRLLARLVRHLSLEKNIPLGQIAIVMRHPDVYSPLIREHFLHYKIPVNITDRFHLEKSAPAIAVFAILDMITSGFRRADCVRALQSPLLELPHDDEGVPFNTENVIACASQLRIIGGHKRSKNGEIYRSGKDEWIVRFEQRLTWLNKRLDGEFEDESDRELYEAELQSMKKAYSDFKKLTSMFSSGTTISTPSDFAKLIREKIIKPFGILRKIEELRKYIYTNKTGSERSALLDEVEKDARALSELLAVLDEMVMIINERAAIRKAQADRITSSSIGELSTEKSTGYTSQKHRSWTLGSLIERFKTTVRGARYQIRERAGLGVTATALEQIRGIKHRVVILCGALDGEFPSAYMPISFLGKEIPGAEEDFLRKERLLFYQTITNNIELYNNSDSSSFENNVPFIFITYPRKEGDRELIRSPFIDALLKITTIEDPQKASTFTENYDTSWQFKPLTKEEFLVGILQEKIPQEAIQFVQFEDSIADGINHVRREKIRKKTAEQAVSLSATNESFNNINSANEIKNIRHFLKTRTSEPISTSTLERYAACPFIYYAEKVLAVREEKYIDETLFSHQEVGILMHRIVLKFYKSLQNSILNEHKASGTKNNEYILFPTKEAVSTNSFKTLELPPIVSVWLNPDEEENYKKLLRKVADEELQAEGFSSPLFEEGIKEIIGGNPDVSIKGALDRWLEGEIGRAKTSWSYAPSLLEFSFGMARKGVKDAIEPILLGDKTESTFYLRGKMDRIEFSPGMSEFIVADYKSGTIKKYTDKKIKKGQVLQIPLYAAAIENILKEYYSLSSRCTGGVYYSLIPKPQKRKETLELVQPIMANSSSLSINSLSTAKGVTAKVENLMTAEEGMQTAIASAQTILGNIEEGNFSQKPASTAQCTLCTYSALCRYKSK